MSEGRRNDEERLQKAVANYLTFAFPEDEHGLPCNQDGLFFFSVPNGGSRSSQVNEKTGKRFSIEGKILKDMGVKAGVNDMLFFWNNNQKGALELKAGDNKLTPKQIIFQKKWQLSGGKIGTAWNLDDVQRVILSWGLHPICTIPPIISNSKRYLRQQIIFNLQKPL